MSGLWYDDEYSQVIASSFLVLRAGLTNGAGKVLEEAGMQRTAIPALDKPPGGMDQLLWEAIWFESLADDAVLFAANNPTPEVVQAARTLAYLDRVTRAIVAAGNVPMPLCEAAFFMSIATANHLQAHGAMPDASPAQEAELAARAERLSRGPERKKELAALWRDPLRSFLESLREAEPATLRLDAPTLWSLWPERNPKEVGRLQSNRLVRWPSDATAHKAVRAIIIEMTAH